jgi:HlyD family secretion protein
MLLAEIDDAVYQTNVASARAQLKDAEAGVARARADVAAAVAKKVQAEQDWARAQKIGPSEALAGSAYDAYKATYEAAVAQVAINEAAVGQAEAAVDMAGAQLQKAERELGYCTIKSPVKGVVISRRVNIGQTVVASLNAPSLFLIAKDLKRIQVLVPVNEADVGQIRPGQPVTFTVDAFPGRTFKGQVRKVRLEVTITQNVVTYPVEIVTENPDEILLPYQTANVRFQTEQRTNVLSVPNAALRYTPPVESMVPEAQEKYAAQAQSGGQPSGAGPSGGPPSGGGPGGGAGRPPGAGGGGGPGPRGAGGGPGGGGRGRSMGTVWVAAGNGLLRPVEVRLGMTDGASTEVVTDALAEGTEVVTGEAPRDGANAPAGGTNPFAPQFPSSRSRR